MSKSGEPSFSFLSSYSGDSSCSDMTDVDVGLEDEDYASKRERGCCEKRE